MKSKSYNYGSRGASIESRRHNSMKTRAELFTALALAGMVTAFVAIKATPTAAQSTIPPGQVTLNFGSFGIAQGQVARINLASLRRPGEANPPEPDRAVLMFLGEDGRVLATQRVEIGAGQSASLELSMDALGLTINRLQLRAKVRLSTPPEPDADPPGEHTIATVEVIERGGRTNFMLPYFIVAGDPPTELGQ
jgi:hypothetical protein